MTEPASGDPQPASPKAFVTGGTGFIGSHLAEELRRRGYGTVRCLVRRDPKWLDGLDVEVVRGDLDDQGALRAGVEGVDYVYHVAGVTRATDREAFEAGNVRATMNLLDAVEAVNPAVRKVLLTSSLAAVGRCREGVATEATPLDPISRYGRSKAEMERAVAARREAGLQLPIVVIRPPAVYGPREKDIFTVFKAASRGLFPIAGRGDVPDLTLVHVRDLVRGMVDAAESERTAGQTYFLGSDTYYSWNEVKLAMAEALGRRVLTVPVPPALIEAVGAAAEGLGRLFRQYPPLNREKAREIRHACKMCAVDKARQDFGYRQRVPLRAGLRETAAWYRAQGWL